MSRMMAPAGWNAPKPQPLPDRYRIVPSDPFGPLPIIEAQNLDTPSSDEMGIEQIVRTLSFAALARSQILEVLPDCPFLRVITVGATVTVSCQSGHRIWKAQDKVPVYAYQYLRSKVLDRWYKGNVKETLRISIFGKADTLFS